MGLEYNFSEEKYLLIGQVSKAHGMKGEVKINLYSGDREQFSRYENVTLVDKKGSLSPLLKINKTRLQGKSVLVLFETIFNRDRAEYIEGMGILLNKEALPTIDEEEYYWHQLIGKAVIDKENQNIGVVKKIFSNTAQDIMVVETARREEILIPIIADIVLETNNDSILIDPPQGLINLNAE